MRRKILIVLGLALILASGCSYNNDQKNEVLDLQYEILLLKEEINDLLLELNAYQSPSMPDKITTTPRICGYQNISGIYANQELVIRLNCNDSSLIHESGQYNVVYSRGSFYINRKKLEFVLDIGEGHTKSIEYDYELNDGILTLYDPIADIELELYNLNSLN